MSNSAQRLRLAVVLCLLAVTSQLPSQILGSGLPKRSLLDRYGLEQAWANQATIDIHSDEVSNVVADEEVVIVQAHSGMMTVFDAETGSRLWDAQLAVSNQFSFPAVTNADTLFVVIGSYVFARDKFSGDELFTLRLPNAPSTAPAVDDDRLYAGLVTGEVYAFELDEVQNLQDRGLLPTWRERAQAWKVATSASVVGPPVTNGEFVAFANKQGVLYTVSAQFRTLNFAFETSKSLSAPMVLGTGKEDGVTRTYIYYPSGDNNFYCLRASNGTTRWTHVSGAALIDSPTVIGNEIYINPLDSGLYHLDPVTGYERWWSPEIHEFVSATPTRIYGSDAAGNLAIISREDGGLIGSLPITDFSIRVRNDRTDRIFICTTRGRVACLKEKELEQPIYHRNPGRRPIVPPMVGDSSPEAIAAPTGDPTGIPATDVGGEGEADTAAEEPIENTQDTDADPAAAEE